jgi:hypothetical protein
MFKKNSLFAPAPLLLCSLILVRPIVAQNVDVLTHRYDNSRSGANLNETTLKKANVNTKSFGKLAFRNIDGNPYAQPLIVTQAAIVNRTTPVDVVIVATEHNSVYAFDSNDTSADPPAGETTKALWKTGTGSPGLGTPADSLTLSRDLGEGTGCVDLTTEIGITGTPVIKLTQTTSPKQGVIFVASKSSTGSKQYSYTLVALNLADGKPLGSGVAIAGGVPGPNGTISFDPFHQLNRPALLLDGNTLYIAFGGHCDVGDYRGWLFAYDVTDPSNPKQIDAFSSTVTTRANENDLNGRGGIWMSGSGPVAVDGGVFFTTGDGTYNVAKPSAREVANSVVKTSLVAGKIQIQDWFAPLNAQNPNNQNGFDMKAFDLDLGSAGPVPIPNSHLLIAGGKEGRWYLIDRSSMGQGAKLSLHSFQVTKTPQPIIPNPAKSGDVLFWNIHGAPVMWPLSGQTFAYVMGEEGALLQHKLIPDTGPAGLKFAADTPFKRSQATAGLPPANIVNDPHRSANVFMPGGFLTLSANGTDTTTGIVWATMPFAENANRAVVRGVLRAFDATDVSKAELWDSEQLPANGLGFFAKFNPPVVANGKVFVAAFQQETIETNTGIHSKAQGGLMPALVIYGLTTH